MSFAGAGNTSDDDKATEKKCFYEIHKPVSSIEVSLCLLDFWVTNKVI